MGYRNEYREVESEVRWTVARLFVFVFLPLAVLVGGGGLVWHFVMKPVEVLDRVTDPDRMIENYQWFIQQDKDIQAQDKLIAEAQAHEDGFKMDAGPRDKWTHDDREEGARLSSITTGLKQQRASMVADYNSRSDQKTRNFLKSHNLPDHYE